jgi:SRSO17 transposase
LEGRGAFRAKLRARGEHYVVDVPCDTRVRLLDEDGDDGGSFERADDWAKRLSSSAWTKVHVRDGEKGPLVVDAVRAEVQTRLNRKAGPRETLLVVRSPGPRPELSFNLAHAPEGTSIEELVRAKSERHRVEEDFERAKGEVGLGHYEVRSWPGWRHHQTLALIALFFLVAEHGRLGGKYSGDDLSSDGRRRGGVAA